MLDPKSIDYSKGRDLYTEFARVMLGFSKDMEITQEQRRDAKLYCLGYVHRMKRERGEIEAMPDLETVIDEIEHALDVQTRPEFGLVEEEGDEE